MAKKLKMFNVAVKNGQGDSVAEVTLLFKKNGSKYYMQGDSHKVLKEAQARVLGVL